MMAMGESLSVRSVKAVRMGYFALITELMGGLDGWMYGWRA